MRTQLLALLTRILAETKKPGTIRTFLIGLIFPEFIVILGQLAELADIVEKSK